MYMYIVYHLTKRKGMFLKNFRSTKSNCICQSEGEVWLSDRSLVLNVVKRGVLVVYPNRVRRKLRKYHNTRTKSVLLIYLIDGVKTRTYIKQPLIEWNKINWAIGGIVHFVPNI